MTLDPSRPDLTIGVVGAGTMGRGIAQLAAAAGCVVLLHDAAPAAIAAAIEHVGRMLRRAAEKGAMTAPEAEAAIARIGAAPSLAAMAPCHVVVEAIIEDLEAKRRLLDALEAVVAPDCVLATNTSSLSVTAIAAGRQRPGQVAGLHFFNPVPLMRIVEVIDGALTEPAVGDGLVALVRRFGHRPVRASDSPGFVVNHAGRGFGTEALRILGEGVAEVPAIDAILRGAGFRMGPFELFDLTGLDVSQPVMEAIYEQFYHEPRYRPSPIARRRLAAGLLGRKTGRGFYAYEEGRQIVPPPPPPPSARPETVWCQDPALAELARALGATVVGAPGEASLLLAAPLGHDATTAALAAGLDARRTVAVDTLFGLDRHRTLMTTPVTDPAYRDMAHGLLASDGVSVSVIHDSPGFVAQRVVAMIVNIGCDIAQQRIASPEDIDRAVTLGLGYPRGPLAWGDAIGPAVVLEILAALEAFYGDPRYRPSPWLRRRARLGVSLLTPEG